MLIALLALSAQQPDSIAPIHWRTVEISSAAVIATGLLLDRTVAHAFITPPSPGTNNTANAFDHFGDGIGIATVIGGLGIASIITRKHATVQALLRTTGSVVAASLLTEITKTVAGRERPYFDSDRDGLDFHPFQGTVAGRESFSSGHTAVAFALATSLSDAAHNRVGSIALYALAAGTGWARLRQNQHWLSDVMAGAAVGVISAKVVAEHLTVDGRGVGVEWKF